MDTLVSRESVDAKELKRRDVPAGVVLVILGIFVFIASANFHGVGGTTYQLNPATVPRAAAVLLIITGTIVLMTRSEASTENKAGWGAKRMWATLAAIIGYVLILEPLGFIISSVLYLLAQGLILRTGKRIGIIYIICTALIVPLPVYLAFVRGLSLRLPAGIFG